MLKRTSLLAAVLVAPLLALPAGHSSPLTGVTSSMPFEVGEKLTYTAKVSAFNAGSATISVDRIEPVRGVPTYHAVFDIQGHVLFKHFDNHYESWFDTTTLVSLRHVEKTPDAEKRYEFYPQQKMYIKNGDTLQNPSVSMPLDECSFLYYLRTLPLDVGKTYTVDRYYHADRNPIVITVVRRERIEVPAGQFDAVLLKPVIKSNGLFSVKGDAEVWLSTDP
jgi:hypothetical protein